MDGQPTTAASPSLARSNAMGWMGCVRSCGRRPALPGVSKTPVDLVYQSREGFEGKVSELLAWIGRMRCMDGWPRGHKRKALDKYIPHWHCCLGIIASLVGYERRAFCVDSGSSDCLAD